MLFKNENEFSLFPKCFFLAAIIFVTLLAGHLMFNDILNWKDITQISAGRYHVLGLKKDGTVVANCFNDGYQLGQCNVASWTDIIQISAGWFYSVGLKSDGTVSLCVRVVVASIEQKSLQFDRAIERLHDNRIFTGV